MNPYGFFTPLNASAMYLVLTVENGDLKGQSEKYIAELLVMENSRENKADDIAFGLETNRSIAPLLPRYKISRRVS